MPLMDDDYLGTNADGSKEKDYCLFCFKNGSFVEPDLTLAGMIAKSIENMTTELGFSKEKAHELANEFIPNLKRWQQ